MPSRRCTARRCTAYSWSWLWSSWLLTLVVRRCSTPTPGPKPALLLSYTPIPTLLDPYAYSSGFSHNIITLHAKVLTFSRGYSQPLWGLHSYTPNPLKS